MKNSVVKISTAAILALTLFFSCGKSGDDAKKTDSSDPLAAAAQMSDADIQKMEAEKKAERLAKLPENHLEIEGDDNMKFDLTELHAKAGKPITLTLKHVGKTKKTEMGHNWIVLKQGTDVDKFAESAIKEVANDYIPQNDPSIIAHTKLLGGGESDSITFTINEKGTYDFLCSFPGHHINMRGKLIIE